MNTTTIRWAIGETTYVVTATADAILSVAHAFATIATEAARRAFLAGLDGDAEEAFFSAVDESLSGAVALPVAA